VQLPKAQKDSQVISVILCFWDLHTKKVALKMLMKLTPCVYHDIGIDQTDTGFSWKASTGLEIKAFAENLDNDNLDKICFFKFREKNYF